MEASDLEQLKVLFLEVRRSTFTWRNIDEFLLSDFERQTRGEEVIVAERDNRIMGFISLWLPDNFIHHLYILADFQGRGIGSLLLEESITVMSGVPQLKCLVAN